MAKTRTLFEDWQEILLMAAGADGGVASVYLTQFIRRCDEEGTDVPFIRDFAKLCRAFENGWPKPKANYKSKFPTEGKGYYRPKKEKD